MKPKPVMGVVVFLLSLCLFYGLWTILSFGNLGLIGGLFYFVGLPAAVSFVALRIELDGKRLHSFLETYILYLLRAKNRSAFGYLRRPVACLRQIKLPARPGSNIATSLPAKVCGRGIRQIVLQRPAGVRLKNGTLFIARNRYQGYADWVLSPSNGDRVKGRIGKPCRLFVTGGKLKVVENAEVRP